MINNLPNVIKTWKSPEIGFSHFDFVFSTNVLSIKPREEMNNLIISLMNEQNY